MINIALVIDAVGSYGSGLLRGISRFAHTHPNWTVEYEPWMEEENLPRWLFRGKFQGVLCRIRNPRQFASLRRLRVPIVDLGSLEPPKGIANIHSDHQAIAELAADHLIQCGLQTFAYCGFESQQASEQRAAAFHAYMSEKGFNPQVFISPSRRGGGAGRSPGWRSSIDYAHLLPWLKALPKPTGIMACNDICGRLVLAGCQHAGIHVPAEIVLVGVDDDEVLCELAVPTMTSINPAADKIGFEAAELLNSIIGGVKVPDKPQLVQPAGVITRTSTDTIAVADKVVAKALRYIREYTGKALTVDKVLDYLANENMLVSRCTLERRFVSVAGFSPYEEINRVRLNRIERLLLNTRYPLTRIAELTGFDAESHLNRFFKRYRGQTPGRFRLQAP
ncbi:MAG: XylR family transcriptional regulator [Phycisphaerae bacterium]